MSGEHFEKQVQQKMEDFTILPSAPVWEAVEKRIGKRKDRRFLIFWIALSAFLATATFFWWRHTPGNRQSPVWDIALKSSRNEGGHGGAAGANAANDAKPGNDRAGDITDPNTRKQQEGALVAAGNNSGVPAPSAKQQSIGLKNKLPAAPGDDISASRSRHTTPAEKEEGHARNVNPDQAEYVEQGGMPFFKEGTNAPAITNGEFGLLKAASINSHNPVKWQPGAVAAPAPLRGHDSAGKQSPVHLMPKHRLTFAFRAGAGVSGISRGFFSGMFNKSAGNLLYNYYAYANNSPGSNAGSTGANMPSALKKGAAFFVSAEAGRKISKRLCITAGLRYAQYSTGIEVGPRSDSVINPIQNFWSLRGISGYYTNTGTGMHHYTNRLQYLEIPLGAEQQLGRRSRFSVNAGISAGWMFATNLLHYDAQNNVYYEDDQLLNRLQISLDAGLRYALLRRNGYSLQLGPQVSYGLSHPVIKPVYGATHLYFAGIEAGIILNRKKQ